MEEHVHNRDYSLNDSINANDVDDIIYRNGQVWNCKKCQIFCNSQQQFEVHLMSQRHKNFNNQIPSITDESQTLNNNKEEEEEEEEDGHNESMNRIKSNNDNTIDDNNNTVDQVEVENRIVETPKVVNPFGIDRNEPNYSIRN
jgi:hypothetical protein